MFYNVKMGDNSKYFFLAFRQIVEERYHQKQKKLAAALGVSTTFVAHMKNGERKIPGDRVEDICAEFGMTFEEMVELGREIAGEGDVCAMPSVEYQPVQKVIEDPETGIGAMLSALVPQAREYITMIKSAVRIKNYGIAAQIMHQLADEIGKHERGGVLVPGADEEGAINNERKDGMGGDELS